MPNPPAHRSREMVTVGRRANEAHELVDVCVGERDHRDRPHSAVFQRTPSS